MLDRIKSVSEVTSYISHLFDTDSVLQNVWVSGELSNLTRASSGHWYFTLKDNDASLRCVMWRSAATRQTFIPREGDALEAHGAISVYAPRGEYQLYVDLLRPVGVGDLYQAFERLKAKLQAEGLFEADRKREPPLFPHRIGVVTSPSAAAFQDILNVLRRRFPLAEVVLSPTMVQGVEAPPQIVRAIERLNHQTEIDVILLCRGGGSIEDLWAFNDEEVARAVAASRIPVITGVGHETDFTIVDFVSDLRAPTPSAAAELAAPSIDEIQQALADQTALLGATMDDALQARRRELDNTRRGLQYNSPAVAIRTARQRIDDLSNRLLRGVRGDLALQRERLAARTRALLTADPKALLDRGYAIVIRSEDGQRVKMADEAPPGTAITVQLAHGELKARVEDKDSHERYQRTLF
ncbi:MAG: exodeoxyribonuclease VII large subunit [Chloroflexota bacterium]